MNKTVALISVRYSYNNVLGGIITNAPVSRRKITVQRLCRSLVWLLVPISPSVLMWRHHVAKLIGWTLQKWHHTQN